MYEAPKVPQSFNFWSFSTQDDYFLKLMTQPASVKSFLQLIVLPLYVQQMISADDNPLSKG